MTAPAWLTERPIAHRGLHDAAHRFENTVSAAEAAIAAGFAIECDVQLSADGEAMVFHDHDLDRLTGAAGPVRERSAAELGRLGIGGSEDRIPTLTEFLDRIGDRTPLVVEIKSRFDGDERLARRTVEILTGRRGRHVVKSFDPAIIGLVRRIAPDLPRGIVGQSRYDAGDAAQLPPERLRAMTDLLHWDETRPDFVSWRHLDLPCAAAFLPRRLAGVPVMTWTIRSGEEACRALPHADQIVFEGFVPA
ncbi:glycerophosphodiester phosphodiesterase family protein [Enterovirga aerilata]|uniref:Glycerophosphodiester phosphodiesterase n=1 Tax=Enterovirga aerilata TaxID=2730920 RepID=A0A849HX67_9HYPH|nr:glycerophosphodiester phosphodiesterase family protein [Enterovirga sp. DB1703]NNM72136.1 glycerophosphodiester phosphodiesterase [Enterovirga sp. DB1703]